MRACHGSGPMTSSGGLGYIVGETTLTQDLINIGEDNKQQDSLYLLEYMAGNMQHGQLHVLGQCSRTCPPLSSIIQEVPQTNDVS